nr:acetyltransferase [Colletotrichum truncatum]KAF6783176.1 acetyltransferase [Colletotrichum truncatum]
MAISPSVLPISDPDFPTLVDFIYSSKVDLAINRFLYRDWPNESAQKLVCRQAVESSFNDPAAHCLKAVDPQSGDVIGYLVLTRRKPAEGSSPKEESTGGQDVPERMNPEVFSTLMQAAKEISQEADKLDCFEITFIYVKLSHRKLGVGSRLIQEARARAKAEGIALSLCSEPTAYEFYVKRGFQDIKHVDIDLCRWTPPYSGYGVYRYTGMVLDSGKI